MADFKRNKFSRGGDRGGFNRRDSSDRSSRGPVEMHQAVCDNCGRDCEVPFKPTSGKPIYCSDCFEKINGDRGPRRDERSSFAPRNDRNSFSDRNDRGPARNDQSSFSRRNEQGSFSSRNENSYPSRDDRRNNDNRENRSSGINPAQIQELNTKLDKILALLTPAIQNEPAQMVSEVMDEQIVEEKAPKVAKKKKASKKTSPVQE